MKSFNENLFKFLCYLCGALLFSMMGIIFAQVVFRYVLQNSLSWSEEIGRYLFIWIVFLGMAAATKAGSHVSLDLLLRSLTGFPQKVLKLVHHILIITLASTILYSGYKLFLLGMRQTSPALSIPMHWVYIVIPVSGLFMLYFALFTLWDFYQENK